MRNRIGWITGFIVVALTLGGWWWFSQDSSSAQEEELDIVEVFRDDLAAGASATGQLVAQQEAQLAMNSGGIVQTVAVSVGDVVAEGDVLIQLDTISLERNVASAEQTLLIQQANLEKLKQGATEAELAAARASVASAQAQLDGVLNGPTPEQISAAEANLRAAEAGVAAASYGFSSAQGGADSAAIIEAQKAVEDAEAAKQQAENAHRLTFDCTYNATLGQHECVGGSDAEKAASISAANANAQYLAAQEQLNKLLPGGNTSGVQSSQASLASAAARRDAAQARLDALLAGPTEVQIAAAEATLAQAQAQLAKLEQGSSAEQITQMEAQVKQAEVSLAKAQNALEDATLTAPFGGVVTAVNVSVGEQASGVVVTLVNLDSLEVVAQIDELDIGSIAIGQEADLIFESYPSETLSGRVVAIAPKNAAGSSNLITYQVNLAFENPGLQLLVGMTANASLVTSERSDVLMVVNRAIRVNRETDTYTVTRIIGDPNTPEGLEEVEITIGLRDGQFTEITSGLNEGDQLLVQNELPLFGPGNGDGEGGGPGGGGPGGGN